MFGHQQSPTPIKSDNSTTTGFVNNNMHQKRSKSWDMKYYWLRDKEVQKQIKACWEKGTTNLADYFTKHHPTKYHQKMRRMHNFLDNQSQDASQWCNLRGYVMTSQTRLISTFFSHVCRLHYDVTSIHQRTKCVVHTFKNQIWNVSNLSFCHLFE